MAFGPNIPNPRITRPGRDCVVKVWDAVTHQEAITLGGLADDITAIVFAPDEDSLIAADYQGTLKTWRTDDWSEIDSTKIPRERLRSLAANAAQGLIAGAGRGEIVRLCKIRQGQIHEYRKLEHQHVEEIQHIAFSPSGRQVASADKNGVILVWTVDQLDPRQPVLGHHSRVWGLAWSPDGTHLAAVDATGALRIWNISTSDDEMVELASLPAGAHRHLISTEPTG